MSKCEGLAQDLLSREAFNGGQVVPVKLVEVARLIKAEVDE
jgi:hypothetical protein